MNRPLEAPNRRILLVDDVPAIHADFRKILCAPPPSGIDAARAAFLGSAAPAALDVPSFAIDSAHQGQEALALVRAALAEARPYALAFVDVRMPPGWDGIETLSRLWEDDPDLQAVLCTAYSDYTWEETFRRLGRSDRLLILKKPFDPIEISQLAVALTEKWNVEHRVRGLIEDLRRKEGEARAYASSLETVNRALETAKAAAEKSAELKAEFLVHLSREISTHATGVLAEVERLGSPSELSAASLDQLDGVRRSSRHLLGALEELADMALLESGRLVTHRVPFAPLEPLEAAVPGLRQEAESKGLRLEILPHAALPEAVAGDPLRIRQILAGLVTQAIRRTERGSIRLALRASTGTPWSSTQLRYTVEDSGPVIPHASLSQLFKAFGREEAGAPGAGLGLAHAQRLARLLGGDLTVESEPGRGTRFELLLDLGLVDPATSAVA